MKEIMNRHAWVLPLLIVGFVAFSSSSVSRPAEEEGLVNGSAAPLSLKLKLATRGVVTFTAAINSNGTVANCFNCVKSKTLHLATGQYQVGFSGNVQANNGWSRWVRPDTLSGGSLVAWCDTADRAGVTTAIFVNCQNHSGPVDTSFFLFVAR